MSFMVGRSMGRTMMLHHSYRTTILESEKQTKWPLGCDPFSPRPFWLQPREVYKLVEEPCCLYASAIFALRERELDCFKCFLSALMFSFWVVIGNNWRQMCNSIEKGYIGQGVLKTDDETLAKINSRLTPDPERAKELRTEFGKGMHGIACRIWPRLYYIDMVCTGTLAHAAKLLQENQLHGVPLLSLYASAVEVLNCVSLDTDPESRTFAFFPIKQYFEWIPEEKVAERNPETLETAQLEVGKCYETVVTTYCGLMRYRTGDIFQCTNKFNQLPEFAFCYRLGQLLNLTGEKVTEKTFYESLLQTCQELHLKLVNYTCTSNRAMTAIEKYVDLCGDPASALPHYLLFCEIENKNGRKRFLSENERKKFDENLRKKGDGLYGPYRECNRLAEMKVLEVKPRTFEKLKALMIQDTQIQQFKMPRVIKRTEFLELLMNQIVPTEQPIEF